MHPITPTTIEELAGLAGLPLEAGRQPMLAASFRGPSGAEESLINAYVRNCGPFNLAGLPIGLQIVGRPFDEATVLRVGQTYESATDWHTRKPPL